VYDFFVDFNFTCRLFIERLVFFEKPESDRIQEQNRKIGVEKVF